MIDLDDPALSSDSMLDELVDVGPGRSSDQTRNEVDAQRYSAWASRLRDKSERDHATILGSPVDPNRSAGYWQSESVLSGNDPVGDPGVAPDQMRRIRLLIELGLSPEATAAEVSMAYRGLAKVHHPDRWVEADEDTRAHHAEKIVRINAVYQALRRDATT